MNFFRRFCQLGVLLSIALSPLCYAKPAKTSDFKKEWNAFLQNKDIDLNEIGSDPHQKHEFVLLQEFSDQQKSRMRPYIQSMDRQRSFRPHQNNKISLKNGSEMSASLISMDHQGNSYQNFIASQAPLEQSIPFFWQMILEQKIDQVVMLTEFLDRDQSRIADLYWPTKLGKPKFFKNGIFLTLLEEEAVLEDLEEYIQIQKILVQSNHEQRIVTHYWYRNWLDNKVPRHVQTIITLLNTVKKQKEISASDSPVLVHCSAGVGRTGIFIVLYHLMERIQYKASEISLFELIASLRWQRPFMVGNLPQYKYCHRMYQSLQELKKQE